MDGQREWVNFQAIAQLNSLFSQINPHTGLLFQLMLLDTLPAFNRRVRGIPESTQKKTNSIQRVKAIIRTITRLEYDNDVAIIGQGI
jgi:signal recognition particle GTPase